MTSNSGLRSTHYHGPVSCCAVARTQGFVPAEQAIDRLSNIFSPFFCFTDKGSLCSSGWPHTRDLLASVSPVLGLQIWCTVPNYKMLSSALTLSFALITREGWWGRCLSSKNWRPPESWTVQCHRARARIPCTGLLSFPSCPRVLSLPHQGQLHQLSGTQATLFVKPICMVILKMKQQLLKTFQY